MIRKILYDKHSRYGEIIKSRLVEEESVPDEWRQCGEQTTLAWRIAEAVHRDQKDKAGKPYLLHSETVARAMNTPQEKAAALLHDVIAESELKTYDLRCFGILRDTVESVIALTRRPDEPYFRYLERSAEDPVATAVKLADLDQDSDLSRYTDPDEDEKERCEYYAWRKEQLLKILDLNRRKQI